MAKLAGVYQIVNLVNNKFYIGSSVNMNRRKAEHFYRFRNIKGNSILKSAIIKYGIENFKFDILEEQYFPINFTTKDKIFYLEHREQFFVDELKPDYNLRVIVYSNRGMQISEERKNILRTMNIGKKNPKISEKVCVPVSSININGDVLKNFKSMKEAGEFYNIDSSNISRFCNGIFKQSKKLNGITFKFSQK